jgi:hypothetical protein
VLVEHLGLLKNDLQGQSIFAYSIFGCSGFDSISIAACTRKGLDESYEAAKDIVKCPYSWFEVNGAEWSYLYHHNEVFEPTNEYFDYLIKTIYLLKMALALGGLRKNFIQMY